MTLQCHGNNRGIHMRRGASRLRGRGGIRMRVLHHARLGTADFASLRMFRRKRIVGAGRVFFNKLYNTYASDGYSKGSEINSS
jgi:hypothetical protein